MYFGGTQWTTRAMRANPDDGVTPVSEAGATEMIAVYSRKHVVPYSTTISTNHLTEW
jgi:hypothetical protein